MPWRIMNCTPKVEHNIWGVFMLKKKRNKFSIDDRERAVLKVIEGGATYRSVARDLQTSHRLVSRWVNSYKLYGTEGLCLRNKIKYTGEFKLQLIMEMNNCHLSLHQMSAKHHISHSLISKWRKAYEQNGTSALFKENPRGRPPKMKDQAKKNKDITSTSKYDKLLEENLRLRAENDYLKKLKALIQEEEDQLSRNARRSSKN